MDVGDLYEVVCCHDHCFLPGCTIVENCARSLRRTRRCTVDWVVRQIGEYLNPFTTMFQHFSGYRMEMIALWDVGTN